MYLQQPSDEFHLDPRELDRESPLALHFQLADLLERRILDGAWPSGTRLPAEPAIAERLALSRTTVRQALARLEQQGLIERIKGRGTFVASSERRSWLLQSSEGFFQDEVERHGRIVTSTILRQALEPLPAWATDALGLPRDARGVTVERLRSVDGHVALYVVNHLIESCADAILGMADGSESLYARLRAALGLEVAGGRRTLEAVSAGDRLGALLGVESQAPLAYVQSLSWDRSQRPFDCYRAWLRTDRMKVEMEVSSRLASLSRGRATP